MLHNKPFCRFCLKVGRMSVLTIFHIYVNRLILLLLILKMYKTKYKLERERVIFFQYMHVYI